MPEVTAIDTAWQQVLAPIFLYVPAKQVFTVSSEYPHRFDMSDLDIPSD